MNREKSITPQTKIDALNNIPALEPFDLSFLDGFRWCDLNLQPFTTDEEDEQ